jgi:hypothetical protein
MDSYSTLIRKCLEDLQDEEEIRAVWVLFGEEKAQELRDRIRETKFIRDLIDE